MRIEPAASPLDEQFTWIVAAEVPPPVPAPMRTEPAPVVEWQLTSWPTDLL